MSRGKSEVRIGISGWRYEPWRGTFYPADLAQKRELEYASRKLNSIEINGSFYSLQRPEFYQQWYDATPDDFVFSMKGRRYITHMKKLRDVDEATANFFASGVLKLKEKFGPILWQFPPNFGFDAERIEAFFKLLPRDTLGAAQLAKKHNNKLKGRAWTRADAKRPIRHAMEVRHHSFKDPAFIKLLRKYNIALVVADTAGKWPYMEDVTADFVYIRLHGDEVLYVSGYDDASLDKWAARISQWRAGKQPTDAKTILDSPPQTRKQRDVYCYFDNDVKVRAPFDAMNLSARLSGRLRLSAKPQAARGALEVAPGATDNCAVAPEARIISEQARTAPAAYRTQTRRNAHVSINFAPHARIIPHKTREISAKSTAFIQLRPCSRNGRDMLRAQAKKQEATLTETLIHWMPALSSVPQIIIEGSLIVLVTLTIFLLTRWGEYLLAAVSGMLYLLPLLRYMMH